MKGAPRRTAAVFRPERGTFRRWAIQIAHYRILNEVLPDAVQVTLERAGGSSEPRGAIVIRWSAK
jgi:hypothetical protein